MNIDAKVGASLILKVTEMFLEVRIFRQTNQNGFEEY